MGEAVFSPRAKISVSPLSASSATTETEREARRLLAAAHPADTARARDLLMATDKRGAEWYFLMGICALRCGYMADAQARLDRACDLSAARGGEAEAEYRAAYNTANHAMDTDPDLGKGPDKQKRRLCADAECWDVCYCCDGCDCCSDCFSGHCDGGDLCHCCDDGCSCDGCCDCN